VWLGYFGGKETRVALSAGLADPDPGVRSTVALALARSGEREKSLPALLEMASKPESVDSGETWLGLGWTRDPAAAAALRKHVETISTDVRYSHFKAVEGLGLCADVSALPMLRKLMLVHADRLRDSATFAAAKLGDPLAKRVFLRRVDDVFKAPEAARPAWWGDLVWQLGQLGGPEATGRLMQFAQRSEPTLKIRTIGALQDIGTVEAADQIVEALKDLSTVGGYASPQRSVREVALRSLWYLTRRSFTGSYEEQAAAFEKWWRDEGKAGFRK
jgi:HEAT repeat protein